MDSIRKQLIDMGFNEAKVQRALQSCPEAQTLEQVMEWLIAHEDELNNQQAPPSAVNKDDGANNQPANEDKDGETAANMAARKRISVEEAQQLIKERQARRVEEERKKEIEDEKRRRFDGQKMAETRAELQDQERIRLAQQIRRDKLEKELHRKQVLEQINRDREAMKARNEAAKMPAEPLTPKTAAKSTPTSSSSSNGTECRIALRFPNGENLVQKFSPKEQLSTVRLFVQTEKNTQAQIEFFAPPNKKLTDADMDTTLEALGLCPASRLEVRMTQQPWTDLD